MKSRQGPIRQGDFILTAEGRAGVGLLQLIPKLLTKIAECRRMVTFGKLVRRTNNSLCATPQLV